MPTRLAGEPCISRDGEKLWFLGTLAVMKLDGSQTDGRFAMWQGVLPVGAAPPLHSHPQDETFVVLEGEVTAWIVESALADDDSDTPEWVRSCGERCTPGTAVFAPGGTPHTFRVESDTAKMLFVSTPAGIENYVRALGEPALWPWLPPPAGGRRVPAKRMAQVERELGMIRHGPPPNP